MLKLMETCLKMCSDAEIDFRSKHHLIHQLEATFSTSSGPKSKYVADREKMVKEYTRPVVDTRISNQSKFLRPYPVLMDTVAYLLKVYEHNKDTNHATAFSFLSDRLRAVRQDMIIQRIKGQEAVNLLEMMIPFYIESDALCKREKCQTYERKLHDTQLEECFGRWFDEIDMMRSIKFSENILVFYFFRKTTFNDNLVHQLYSFRKRNTMLSNETFLKISGISVEISSINPFIDFSEELKFKGSQF